MCQGTKCGREKEQTRKTESLWWWKSGEEISQTKAWPTQEN